MGEVGIFSEDDRVELLQGEVSDTFRLPAITNAKGATRVFQTGDELVPRADTATVERI